MRDERTRRGRRRRSLRGDVRVRVRPPRRLVHRGQPGRSIEFSDRAERSVATRPDRHRPRGGRRAPRGRRRVADARHGHLARRPHRDRRGVRRARLSRRARRATRSERREIPRRPRRDRRGARRGVSRRRGALAVGIVSAVASPRDEPVRRVDVRSMRGERFGTRRRRRRSHATRRARAPARARAHITRVARRDDHVGRVVVRVPGHERASFGLQGVFRRAPRRPRCGSFVGRVVGYASVLGLPRRAPALRARRVGPSATDHRRVPHAHRRRRERRRVFAARVVVFGPPRARPSALPGRRVFRTRRSRRQFRSRGVHPDGRLRRGRRRGSSRAPGTPRHPRAAHPRLLERDARDGEHGSRDGGRDDGRDGDRDRNRRAGTDVGVVRRASSMRRASRRRRREIGSSRARHLRVGRRRFDSLPSRARDRIVHTPARVGVREAAERRATGRGRDVDPSGGGGRVAPTRILRDANLALPRRPGARPRGRATVRGSLRDDSLGRGAAHVRASRRG